MIIYLSFVYFVLNVWMLIEGEIQINNMLLHLGFILVLLSISSIKTKCERERIGGLCALEKTKEECIICKRNHEILESRRMASYVEKMNETEDVHELNRLYNEAEKELFNVYGAVFNRIMKTN